MNILDSKAIKGFIKVADMGWQMGWHEINGGNMSYRMTDEEVNEIKENFNLLLDHWLPNNLKKSGYSILPISFENEKMTVKWHNEWNGIKV